MWGEETNPTRLSTIPGDYRNPLVSTLGAQQRPGVLTKGRATPGAGSGEVVSPWSVWKCGPVQALGIVWLSPHPCGSGSCVHGEHMSALSLQCVLSPRRFPASELRVLPWITCGPFPSLHLVAFTWGQAGCCSVFCWVKTFGGVVLISAYPMSNHRGHHCLVSPRPSSGNLICNLIIILYWSLVDFQCFVLGIYELHLVIHRHISILLLFFPSCKILPFFQ